MNYVDFAKALDKVYNDYVEGKTDIKFDDSLTPEQLAILIERFISLLMKKQIHKRKENTNVDTDYN